MVFLNSPVATPAYGLLGLHPSFRLRFISDDASLLCMFVPPPTAPLHQVGPLSLCLVTVHIFSFHVWPFAFMLQVTWTKQYRS